MKKEHPLASILQLNPNGSCVVGYADYKDTGRRAFGGFPGAERSVCGGTAWDFGDGNRRGDRRKEVNRTGKLSDGTSGCGGRADTGRTGGEDPDSGDWNIKWS